MEVSSSDDDSDLYALFQVLVAGGAKIQGGAPVETTDGRKPLLVLQESNSVEFTLDDGNCLKDFKGSIIKVKGIAMGLRLCAINSQDVRGWPRWIVERKLADSTTACPMTCEFFQCAATQSLIDDSVEHCVGKKAVVAGTTPAAIALANLLVAEGADVAILDSDPTAVADSVIADQFHTVGQMEFAKRSVKGFAVELADATAVHAAVDAVLGDFGSVDILINAAVSGGSFVVNGATNAVDFLEDFDKHFGQNVGSAINVSKAVLEKAMVPAKAGCCITLSYAMGREGAALAEPSPMSFGFGYSMQAVEALTRCWADENDDAGVRCNILMCGRMQNDGLPEDALAEVLEPSHLKKGLLVCLDTDGLNGEVVDAMAESKR
eukprot:SAG31_NODE_529_length_14420_cov_20.000140_16_plen_378_part_00